MGHDEIERVSRFYTHRFLWKASQHLQQIASSEDNRGSRYLRYTSLLTLFFALAAYINFLGKATFPKEWKKANFKKDPYRGTLGKLRWLAEEKRLDVPLLLDTSVRPVQTFIVMQKVRNHLAHGKLDIVRTVEKKDLNSLEWMKDFIPSKLEHYVHSGFENNALEDVEEATKILHQAAMEAYPYNRELRLTPHPLRGTERMEVGGTT